MTNEINGTPTTEEQVFCWGMECVGPLFQSLSLWSVKKKANQKGEIIVASEPYHTVSGQTCEELIRCHPPPNSNSKNDKAEQTENQYFPRAHQGTDFQDKRQLYTLEGQVNPESWLSWLTCSRNSWSHSWRTSSMLSLRLLGAAVLGDGVATVPWALSSRSSPGSHGKDSRAPLQALAEGRKE